MNVCEHVSNIGLLFYRSLAFPKVPLPEEPFYGKDFYRTMSGKILSYFLQIITTKGRTVSNLRHTGIDFLSIKTD